MRRTSITLERAKRMKRYQRRVVMLKSGARETKYMDFLKERIIQLHITIYQSQLLLIVHQLNLISANDSHIYGQLSSEHQYHAMKNKVIIINTMFKFTEVGVCHESLAERVDYNNPDNAKKVIKGDLGVFIEVSTGMLLFKMEEFEYGINNNDQVLYEDKDSDFKLILCLDADPSNCWFVKVNQNMQLLFFVLSERCKLIHRNAARLIISETESCVVEPGKSEEVEVKASSGNQDGNKAEGQSTEKLLIQSSKLLSKGLALAGKALSRGLEKLGSLISKKVEPSEAVHVSEESKQLIRTSVSGSKKILEVTSEQVAALFRIAKKEAIKLADNFEKSEKGKEWQKKEEYSLIKRGLLTGVHVIGNLYEGLAEGLGEASIGLGKGSAEVIGAKYGKDAGEASLGVVEGAKNVIGIYKIPRNEAKKAFKPTESEVERSQK